MTEAEAAAPGITAAARPEYERIVNDMRAIAALMAYYNAKTQAAALVMRFGYDHNVDLVAARPLLAESVADFAKLTNLTDKTYRNAAGMQTSQRQIPVRGGPQTNHWRDLLPVYQKEFATFDSRLKVLDSNAQMSASDPAAKPAGRLHPCARRRRSLHCRYRRKPLLGRMRPSLRSRRNSMGSRASASPLNRRRRFTSRLTNPRKFWWASSNPTRRRR